MPKSLKRNKSPPLPATDQEDDRRVGDVTLSSVGREGYYYAGDRICIDNPSGFFQTTKLFYSVQGTKFFSHSMKENLRLPNNTNRTMS